VLDPLSRLILTRGLHGAVVTHGVGSIVTIDGWIAPDGGPRMLCHDAIGELPTRRPSQEHGIGPPIDPHALLFKTVGGVMMGGDLRSVVSP
jgi:hypothetical protein